MIVVVCENVRAALRGELRRWLIEVRAGVYVGSVSALVREALWQRICDNSKAGSVLLIHSTTSEQGFSIRTRRDRQRYPEDIEGLTLMRFS